MIRPFAACLIFFSTASVARSEEPTARTLQAPADWKQERIELPPGFAPDMKLRGVEELRFAPGMYRAESASFLSYVFTFRLPEAPELTESVLERELLAYYRGLATAVLKETDTPVDPGAFSVRLKESPATPEDSPPQGGKRYGGDVKWIEPFVTRQPQTLHLEVDAWRDPQDNSGNLFACISPQPPTAAIWKEMRSIRAAYVGADRVARRILFPQFPEAQGARSSSSRIQLAFSSDFWLNRPAKKIVERLKATRYIGGEGKACNRRRRKMAGWMLAAMLFAAEPAASETATAELKGFHLYQAELRDALRREATAESPGRRAAAIRDLAALYEEIAADSRLETSDTLSEMRIKLWNRLTAIRRDLERQIARDAKTGERTQFESPGDAESAGQALAARLARWSYSVDGPASLAAGNEAAFGGGAVIGDWGPALVTLIERTIAPDKWDTVGGPFSIMYFAPLKVLVVRATAEVHNDLGGVVGGLRKAGP